MLESCIQKLSRHLHKAQQYPELHRLAGELRCGQRFPISLGSKRKKQFLFGVYIISSTYSNGITPSEKYYPRDFLKDPKMLVVMARVGSGHLDRASQKKISNIVSKSVENS